MSGTLDLVLETSTPGMKLLFFDDETNSWPRVYGSSMSCEAKTAVAKKCVAPRRGRRRPLCAPTPPFSAPRAQWMS